MKKFDFQMITHHYHEPLGLDVKLTEWSALGWEIKGVLPPPHGGSISVILLQRERPHAQ